MHGTQDDNIPYDLNSPDCVGEGPHGTIIAFDGFYYYPKATVIETYVSALECLPGVPWPTFMDGVQGFSCTIYTGLTCHPSFGEFHLSHFVQTAVVEVRW